MIMERPLISVVSPEYRGAGIIPELVRRNISALETLTGNFEIILVNDCSPDDTWNAILAECANDRRVKGINLSRNFGQHYAISAGLANASGEWVVIMDCDLQDAPEDIPALYKKALEGFDVVQARRINKKFGVWKRFTSVLFHRIFDWLSGCSTDESIGNFCICSRKVIDSINDIQERTRSLESMLRYIGFRTTTIDVEHNERAEGQSSYTFSKLMRHASDVIIADTNKPLRLGVGIGLVIAIVSFCLAIYNVIAKLAGIITLQGYTTTVFSIWFVGGLILLILGVLGLYIGKIFDQVKGRQIYIIKDKINFK